MANARMTDGLWSCFDFLYVRKISRFELYEPNSAVDLTAKVQRTTAALNSYDNMTFLVALKNLFANRSTFPIATIIEMAHGLYMVAFSLLPSQQPVWLDGQQGWIPSILAWNLWLRPSIITLIWLGFPEATVRFWMDFGGESSSDNICNIQFLLAS